MGSLKIRKKSRVGTKICGKCGYLVLIGEYYRRYDIKTSYKSAKRIFRCMNQDCTPTPREITSGHRGEFLTAKYNFDRIRYSSDTSSLISEFEDINDQLSGVYDAIESGVNNLPESLQNSTSGVIASDRLDAIETIKGEIDEVISGLNEAEEEKGGVTEEEFNSLISRVSSWDDFI